MSTRKDKAKSAGSYLLGGTKVSLSLLGSLADVIPAPWIKSAIGAATKVIEIAEAVQSNWENRQKLIDHVYALMLVIIIPLQKKTEAEIPPGLKANMERLSGDLTAIAQELSKLNKDTDPHRVRGFMRSVVLVSKYTGQIQDCTNRLNWAMNVFQVADRIDGALSNARIENGVENIQIGIQDIKLTLKNNVNEAPKLSSHLSTVIPPKPAVFCGRDDEVNDIVHRILTEPSPRFAIRGPGGIGKTSAAVAISQHKDILRRFGSLRFWARCEEANSPGLLLDILARVLHVTTRSNDPLRDIVSALSTDDQPRLLILDNFETPLDIEGRHSDILEILGSLFSIPHVSILLTLRGALPGSNDIQWTQPELLPLSTLSIESAREMFVASCPKAIEDKNLDTLLIELGGMPLAVKLLAERGRLGDSPSTLLKLWREEGPDMVDEPGADRRTSVNKSIQLSLQSNIIKANPDAIPLLSVLAFLPSGAQSTLIESLIPTMSSSGHSKARTALLRTSLIYATLDGSAYLVLSPIRSFMARHHQLTSELWEGVFQCYARFLELHKSNFGEPDFLEKVEVVGKEETNVETVLLRALQPDGKGVTTVAVIETSLTYTLYQHQTLPRSEVAIAAVKAAGLQNETNLLPRTLQRLGDIQQMQSRYNEARATLQKAQREFERVGEPLGAAQCLRSLGDIERMQGRYDEARATLQKAQREFERLGDPLGAAQCLRSLGNIEYMQGRYDEARGTLQKAQREFERLGDPLGAAQCLRSLGNIEYMQGRYDEARATLQKAQREFERLGEPLGAAQCLQSLGNIEYMQGRYDEARGALQKAQREFKSLGNPLGAAQCLQSLGDIEHMQGRYDEARATLQKAQREFERVGEPLGAAQCLRSLGHIEHMQGRYDEARATLQKAQREFERLGEPLGAAQCLRSLGHIEHMQGRYDEARATLQKAQREFERLGEPLGAAQCLQSLGHIEHMQGRYDEARGALQKAQREFESLGNPLGVRQCLKILHKIETAQGR